MKKAKPPCPRCGQTTVVSNGSLNTKKARVKKYFCKSCSHYFSTFSGTVFWYREKTLNAIAFALEAIIQLGLTYTQTHLVLKRWLNESVSKATLSLWTTTFKGIQLPKPEFTNVWHVDEVFVKHEERLPFGKRVWFSYLWVVSDSKQQLIALHHSEHRDLNAAREVLAKARREAGFVPRVIVSDEYLVYPRAVRAVLRGALHVTAHFELKNFVWRNEAWSLSNNSAESLNSRLRDRLRRRRGLKLCSPFLVCLQSVWNSRLVQSLARALLQAVPR